MANQQLVDYINQSRKNGVSDAQIKQAILGSGSGWTEQDINLAMGAGQIPVPQNPAPVSAMNSAQAASLGNVGGYTFAKIAVVLIIVAILAIGGWFGFGYYNKSKVVEQAELPLPSSGISQSSDEAPSQISSPQAAQTLIKVLSPSGGENWKKGTTQTIRWEYLGYDNCQKVEGGCTNDIAYHISLLPVGAEHNGIKIAARGFSNFSYQWTIPNCTTDKPCSSNFEIPNGIYNIKICRTTNATIGCGSSSAPVTIGQ